MATILIAGCGAIGLELAKQLANLGHQVTGLKRHPPNQTQANLQFFAADLTQADSLRNLNTHFEVVYFILSAGNRNESDYQEIYHTGLNNLIAHFAEAEQTPQWFFVSSTSVYAQDAGEWLDENSEAAPVNPTSQWIRQAEQRITALHPSNIVVRLAGIYGPGREYLLRMARSGVAIQQHPPYYTNRIHAADCVGVLEFLLTQSLAGKALEQYYLASDDQPVPLWEVISWLAEQLGCAAPEAKSVTAPYSMNKRCDNGKLKALGYQFRYPHFKVGYAELL